MARKGRLRIPREQIRQFCERHIFGSVLRDGFKSSSDVDVLIEFRPGNRVGLFKIARMERELSDLMGRKVDLRTPKDLSRYFRQDVLDNAEVQYAGDVGGVVSQCDLFPGKEGK